MRQTYFRVIDKNTKEELAVLPTTIPVGVVLDGYEEAGYEVAWTWAKKEDKQ